MNNYTIKLSDLNLNMTKKTILVLEEIVDEVEGISYSAFRTVAAEAMHIEDHILIIADDKSFILLLPKHEILNHMKVILDDPITAELLLNEEINDTDKCEALLLKGINIEEKFDAYLHQKYQNKCTASIFINIPKPIIGCNGNYPDKEKFFNIVEHGIPSINDAAYIAIDG